MQGVGRNMVVLAPHDAAWAAEFEKTRELLLDILGGTVIDIQHVGSTAIAGIVAKPILDVAVVVSDLQALAIDDMKAAGYDPCGERGVAGRFLFVKRGEGDISLHHIHCYAPDNENLRVTLMFRNYLNAHPQAAQEYSMLKTKLAAEYPHDRIAYTEAKAGFIERIIGLAEREGECTSQ